MDKGQYQNHLNILKSELKVALGCTEPIAIAYAAAKARQVLGMMPESCIVKCSGNIVKNVKGVVVPNSGGLRGIEAAAVLGIVGGDPNLQLAVLQGVNQQHQKIANQMLADGFCSCTLAEGVENLYVLVEVSARGHYVQVEIQEYHSNITKVVKDGRTLLEKAFTPKEGCTAQIDKNAINLRSILEFADNLCLTDIQTELDRQFTYNINISNEGLQHHWGVGSGKSLLEEERGSTPGLHIRARAAAAAGSDARMGGCPLPVVINSGSGNQGITLTLPIYIYAEEYNISNDIRWRALALANLISVHQKKYIGQLSAYCGAVSAATAAACGIVYMMMYSSSSRQEIYRVMADTITNSICTIGGMVCDGAKASCASKISVAVETALDAMDLAMKGQVFQAGEGLTASDVESTIRDVGRLGRDGMFRTDLEILNIMLGK